MVCPYLLSIIGDSIAPMGGTAYTRREETRGSAVWHTILVN